MKLFYRVMSLIGLLFFSAIIIFSYLFSYIKIEEVYEKQTEENIISLRKNFLKDTVNNIINEIEDTRESKKEHYEKLVKGKKEHINAGMNLSDTELLYFFIDNFNNEAITEIWTYVIIDLRTQKLVYSSNEDYYELKIDDIRPKFSTCEEITNGTYLGIYGIEEVFLDNDTQEMMLNKIRKLRYEADSYLWINEVINYDGGDGYAKRLVHPNFPDTEGMLLSTSMEDIRGKLPYLEELEGVKRKGDIFSTYHFKKLNSEEISEKLTYAKLYKRYDWIIAMGVHIDDVEEYVINANYESKLLVSKVTAKIIIIVVVMLMLGYSLFIYIEERKFRYSNKELETKINQDPLTLSYNRRFGENELKRLFKKDMYEKSNTAIMLLDVDDFKYINDNYGHDFGDKVLIYIVSVIKDTIRETDVLIRWGGDEFILLLYGLRKGISKEFAYKINSKISKNDLVYKNEPIKITASIGISYFKKEDLDYKEAIKRADFAMYLSKKKGKGLVHINM